MQPIIDSHRAELAAICRRFHVRKLDLFGSAARDDFDPEHSDFDFLVAFDNDVPTGGFDAYFGLKDALESLLGRTVDLVMDGAVENPYLKRSIERSRKAVYAT
jgi:predicted nucleotidyltransferase